MRLIVTKDTLPLRSKFREKRDAWLDITDIYMLADNYAALTSDEQQQLLIYREALRDAPNPEISAVFWILPPKPSFITEEIEVPD
jgi:hypothetical protein